MNSQKSYSLGSIIFNDDDLLDFFAIKHPKKPNGAYYGDYQNYLVCMQNQLDRLSNVDQNDFVEYYNLKYETNHKVASYSKLIIHKSPHGKYY